MLGSLSEAGRVDGDLIVVQDLAVWEKFALMMLGLGVSFFFFLSILKIPLLAKENCHSWWHQAEVCHRSGMPRERSWIFLPVAGVLHSWEVGERKGHKCHHQKKKKKMRI